MLNTKDLFIYYFKLFELRFYKFFCSLLESIKCWVSCGGYANDSMYIYLNQII